MQLGEDINQYEQKIDGLIELLEIEDAEINLEEELTEESDKRTIPNYAAYYVDTNVEYTLYENFTHKRSFAFRINDNKIIEVRTWQEMLIKTCELLIAVDEEKFIAFESNRSMNGKKNKYFSISEDGMRQPRTISGKIFVESNMSGNGIRNLLLKILKEFGYKTNDYKVYLKADYTAINS